MSRTRLRSRLKLARPYIWRSIILKLRGIVPRAGSSARGVAAYKGLRCPYRGLGGEVAGDSPAQALRPSCCGCGSIWGGASNRTIDAYAHGLAEHLTRCVREDVDPQASSRADVAGHVKELTERPSRQGPNVISENWVPAWRTPQFSSVSCRRGCGTGPSGHVDLAVLRPKQRRDR